MREDQGERIRDQDTQVGFYSEKMIAVKDDDWNRERKKIVVRVT